MTEEVEVWEAALNDYIDIKIADGQYEHHIGPNYVINGQVYAKDHRGLWASIAEMRHFTLEEIAADSAWGARKQKTHNWKEEGF